MNKEQAVTYLRFSGFSDEQIKAIEGAFTCEDAISRQTVLDLLENTNNGWIINKVLQLPPVNPQKPICPSAGVDCEDCPAYEPKTGYWVKSIWSKDVWECSECGWEIYDQEAKTNYCPSCGCRMVEPQEGSEKE